MPRDHLRKTRTTNKQTAAVCYLYHHSTENKSVVPIIEESGVIGIRRKLLSYLPAASEPDPERRWTLIMFPPLTEGLSCGTL